MRSSAMCSVMWMNVTHGDFIGLIPVFVMLTSALAMVIRNMRTKKRWIQDHAPAY